MIENDEYYLAVKEDLLNEKRLEQREKEAKSYGIMPGIAYVGTIDGNEQGKQHAFQGGRRELGRAGSHRHPEG